MFELLFFCLGKINKLLVTIWDTSWVADYGE